jgi:Uma2 family endonuclease
VLVVEVLSPSTARHDRLLKRALYQRQRIATIWLVDPEEQLVEVWTPEAHAPSIEREQVVWTMAKGGTLVRIDLRELFAP